MTEERGVSHREESERGGRERERERERERRKRAARRVRREERNELGLGLREAAADAPHYVVALPQWAIVVPPLGRPIKRVVPVLVPRAANVAQARH
jgi:hypothetical protein